MFHLAVKVEVMWALAPCGVLAAIIGSIFTETKRVKVSEVLIRVKENRKREDTVIYFWRNDVSAREYFNPYRRSQSSVSFPNATQ
jgi:hypothetical protein